LQHHCDTLRNTPIKKNNMQNVSIIPQLKKKKAIHTSGTIIIRGFYNRRPVASISTGYKVEQQHWDIEGKKVKSSAPNAMLINQCIQMKLQQMQSQLMKHEIMGGNINRSRIRAAVKGINPSRDFIKFCKDSITANYTNTETIRTYESEITKVSQFQVDVSFADIDFKFLQSYKNYMEQQLGNSDNTVWKSFKFLNTFINMAIKQGGIIEENPFKEFNRGKYIQTQRDWLELEECDMIFQLLNRDDIPVVVKRVALYFLLMCYSGLRFEDAMAFDPDVHIIQNQRLVKRTSKGKGKVVNIKMWDRLTVIIDLVKENAINLSNKKFNEWLQVVQSLSGVSKHLTAHLGRHTFGGLLADADISIEQAKELLGHHDIRSTKIYYHMKNKKLDEAASKLNNL
jgi:integrase/recombinase XerD